MRVDVVTIFPEFVCQGFGFSIMARAAQRGLVDLRAHDLRQWTDDPHRTVDDTPYGGGAGMVMKPEPFYRAVQELKQPDGAVVLLTPAGRTFDQACACELSQRSQVILLCGHYEGIDERVGALAELELSIGDYVLTGAELAALVVSDAVVRLQPGVLGNADSAVEESFSGLLEYPQYTRPREFRGLAVPEVLVTGHHEQVRRWRRAQALARTAARRPDVLARAEMSEEDWQLLREADSQSQE